MKTTNKYYNKLKEFKTNYKELTFQNEGYEYIKPEIIEKHKNQIEEIESLLKDTIKGFVKFNNFKDRKKGGFDVRVQYHYDESFIGVGYFHIDEFKDFEI